MAVRIRVYPQYGGLGMNGMNRFGMNGMNGMGGAVSAQTYFNSRLQTQKQVSTLQLGYERALANERIDRVRLEERLKNPYLAAGTGFAGAYGGLPVGLPMGGLPIGGLPLGLPMGGAQFGGLPMGGIPTGFPGGGQSNTTNQVSTGGASQSVSNSNVSNVSHHVQQPGFGGGWGHPGVRFGGGGGFLSGLLGALI
jgi:hypothetical protein